MAMLLVEQVEYECLLVAGIFIIWDVLDEDAAGTVGRKPDNNVFITKFLIIVQIKVYCNDFIVGTSTA